MAKKLGVWAMNVTKYKFGSNKNLISSQAKYVVLDSAEDGLALPKEEFDTMIKELKNDFKQNIKVEDDRYPLIEGATCSELNF